MELWVGLTFAAAFLQNLRSAGQKHIKSVMGTTGATFVRFGFGVPFALAFLFLATRATGLELPSPPLAFWLWVVAGGTVQIAGTFLLVHLFSFRNFAVGTAYSRTEPMQTALLGLVLLGETLTPGGLAAIAITVLGVILISIARTPLTWHHMRGAVLGRNALIGLGSGLCFGLAAVSYRAGSLSLGGPHFLVQAALTLVAALTVQTLAMGLWMAVFDRDELWRIARAWRPGLFTGAMGAMASMCWFTAITLQSAALVKALGQIEMLFTFASAVLFFNERVNRLETLGCALIVSGIVVLLLLG